ncbi:MAG: T9SS type A sorting domain-containing protein [Rhodothermia bacterium]
MKFILPMLAIAAFTAGSAAAQQLMEPFPATENRSKDGAGRLRCATPYLMSTPEGRAALASFYEARQSGQLPIASKIQKTYVIGQSAAFNIISDSAWTSAEFELRTTGDRWRAWLRSDIPGQQQINQSRFEQMQATLNDQTPPASIEPAKGIFDNNEDIFGDPLIYPEGSDGIVDILIYELDQGVAGFVSPADYDPNAAETVGNQSEIIYLDIDNFFVTGSGSMESVIAHEYQHVIHINYDTRETSFVNEGQSEYAQQMNGYPVVPPFHLYGRNPEYNINLFNWRGRNLLDYTRGSLWTGYLAERVGAQAVGLVTQSNRVGLGGYQDAFQKAGTDLSVQDLIADFHTANLINDRTVDPRFGYVSEQRRGELGGMQVPASARFDGSDETTLQLDSLIVKAGGAAYLVLENVMDLSLTVDVRAPADQLENRRSQMLVRAIGTDLDGATSMVEFNPGEKIHLLKGSFDKVRLVFAHLRPESTQLRTTLEANWSQDPDRQVETIGYSTDDGRTTLVDGQRTALAFGIDSRGEGAQATMFVPQPGAVLDRVTLATFYFSQFQGGGSPDAPRDFTFTIWESNGFGEPGAVIYSKVIEDPVPYILVRTTTYNWFDIDLDPPLGKRSTALPDTIFVGLQNAGTDQNYLVAWPSSFRGSPARETGFIRLREQDGQLAWVPLWDVQIGGGNLGQRPLNRTALPVRARFVIDTRPVAIEESSEVPRRIELDQNYPNPFNPSTQIRFSLTEVADIGLEVFDVTGRRVANLTDGVKAPGTYTVTLDATNWTSGVYFYRLTAGSQQILKRMVLLK